MSGTDGSNPTFGDMLRAKTDEELAELLYYGDHEYTAWVAFHIRKERGTLDTTIPVRRLRAFLWDTQGEPSA
jgi:hypothetical protein